MFKKKTNIPPRPKPPIPEQILEDLQNAPDDDEVFSLMKQEVNQEFLQESEDATITTTSGYSYEDMCNPEFVFQRVKNFVEVNHSLQQIMQKLLLQNEALQMSDRELKCMAEEIRKQALDALK